MNLKLSKSEFFSLYLLLETSIADVRPKGIEATALHGLLHGIYKKFYIRAFVTRDKYSVTITDAEACAFYMFFSKHGLKGENTHAINLVIQINSSIHQKFS